MANVPVEFIAICNLRTSNKRFNDVFLRFLFLHPGMYSLPGVTKKFNSIFDLCSSFAVGDTLKSFTGY